MPVLTTKQQLSKAQADLKIQVDKVSSLNAEITTLKSNHSKAISLKNKQITSLKNSHKLATSKLETQLDEAQTAKANAEAAYATMEKKYNDKSKDYSAKASQVAGLNARIRALEKTEKAHETLSADYASLQKAKRNSDALVGQLRNARSKLQGENSELNNKLAKFESTQLELANLKQSLSSERESWASRETELANQLEQQQAELETMRGQLAGEAPDTTVSKVVMETGMGLKTAQDALKRSGTGFRIGKLSMDLKMVPAQGGNGIRFPSKEEMSTGSSSFSTMSLDFSPDKATPETEDALLTAPRLRGYTETMAKRKLAAFGLGLDVSFEPVSQDSGKANMVGRVVRQWPEAGELMGDDTTVLVAIGKAAGESNGNGEQ